MIEVTFASRQFQGARPNQEDSCGFFPVSGLGLLGILADGMGGYQAGEVASEIAVNEFVAGFLAASKYSNAARLEAGLQTANTAVCNRIRSSPEQYSSMGTTLLGVLATPTGMEWISVGDSKLYVWSVQRRVLRHLNANHSMDAEIRKRLIAGVSNDEAVDLIRKRNNLTSAIIGEELSLVDTPVNPTTGELRPPFVFEEGDVLIAASDGIDSLKEWEFQKKIETYAKEPAGEIAERLLQAVEIRRQPNQDNTSVLVVRLGGWLADPL